MLIALLASLVLSTLPKPTIDEVIPLTVPVKVGDARGAFNASPGTVGALAIPPRSPANCILPKDIVVASATDPDVMAAST